MQLASAKQLDNWGTLKVEGRNRPYRVLYFLQLSRIRQNIYTKFSKFSSYWFSWYVFVCKPTYLTSLRFSEIYLILIKRLSKVISLSLHKGSANKITAVWEMRRTYYLHWCFGWIHAPPFLQKNWHLHWKGNNNKKDGNLWRSWPLAQPYRVSLFTS